MMHYQHNPADQDLSVGRVDVSPDGSLTISLDNEKRDGHVSLHFLPLEAEGIFYALKAWREEHDRN